MHTKHPEGQTAGGAGPKAARMPRFVFQVQPGQFPEHPAIEDEFCDGHAARKAALGICADLAKDIVVGLTEDTEWRLEVLNEAGQAVFRLRLVAETLEAIA